MKTVYFSYLHNGRRNAFVQGLAEVSEELLVVDFGLLRRVYRRTPLSHREARETLAQLGRDGCRLRHWLCPAISLGKHGWRAQLSLLLSAGLALLYAGLVPLGLLGISLKTAVFYNGHPLFALAWWLLGLKSVNRVTDLGDVLYLLENPNPATRALEAHFVRRSDRVICVSRPFKEWLQRELGLPSERISVLSAALPANFADAFDEPRNERRREQLRIEIGAKPNDLVLAYAGFRWFRQVEGRGLVDVQGVDLLCEAVHELNREGRVTHLVILGTPADDAHLAPLIAGEWRHRFHVWGTYRPLDERHTMGLGGADLLCIPSAGSQIYQLYDRFKMYEYLAAGKTPVVADVPINRDVFGDDAIYYPDEGRALAMAQAIREQSQRAVCFNPRYNERVRQEYNWDERVRTGDVRTAIFGPGVVERY